MAGKPGQAQVVLKPNGQNAAPLRVKTLRAKAVIESAQFATTDLDLTFQNEVNERIEADFLYTLPEGAVVTDFAYFYGDERVVARIAEKKRAAMIYQYITSRMRDPALVEMVGKNTFRARIFPVMPNADLRVQIRFVQVLPANAQGTVTYTMPLRTEKSVRWGALSLDVRVAGLERGASVTNNFGLPVVVRGGSPHFGFSTQNYRTDKDLRVGITLPPAPVQAHLVSARAGGQNGFFALAVGGKTPPRFAGISTYDVETAPLGNGLLVCGRYKNSGTARLSLAGAPPVRFESAARTGSPSEKLWAALRIARLSKSPENRDAVVALSHRFTIPSKWTSWIAIPVEERKRYENEKNAADLEIVAQKLADLIDRNRDNSREARAVRAQFDALCKKVGRNPKEELQYHLGHRTLNRINQTARRLAELMDKGRASGSEARGLRRELQAIARKTGANTQSILTQYLSERTMTRMDQAARDVVSFIAEGRTNSREAQQARARLNAICKVSGANPGDWINDKLDAQMVRYEEKVAAFIEEGKENTPLGQKQWRAFRALCEARKISPESFLQSVLPARIQQKAQHWAAQTQATRVEVTRGDATGVTLQPATNLSPEQKQALQAKVERLAKAVKRDPQTYLDQAKEEQQTRNLFDLRQNIDNARYNTPTNKAQIDALSRLFLETVQHDHAWKRANADPNGKQAYYGNNSYYRSPYVRNQIARLATRYETEQIDQALARIPTSVDTADLKARRAELAKRESELRARMGDPLITVDAPRDARTVVAQMPGGDLLPLRWDPASQTWQARFDIPTYAAEGAYVVTVLIVRRDGTRESRTFRYNVDVTAPKGTVSVARTETGGLRLEVNADEDTARVVALLPGGDVVLTASAPGRFFALAEGAGDMGGTITFILTDRAHNRTTLTTEIEAAR